MPVDATAPLVIDDGTTIHLFSSAQAAGENLAPGSLSESAVGYDAEGRLLELIPHPMPHSWLPGRRGSVEVAAAEDEPTHRAQLEALVRELLDAAEDPPLVEASLEDLVQRALTRVGYTA
jgi:hypothetical protein